MLNAFRFLGDGFHLLSFVILFYKIVRGRNVEGISRNTQDLYAVVFFLRYSDIAWNHAMLYNVVLKICFVFFASWISVIMRRRDIRCTYQDDHDSVGRAHVLIPSTVVGLAACQFLATVRTPFEYAWHVSLVLEAFAIVPQLVMLQKNGTIDNITSHYVASLGIYRMFYIFNWIYRWRVQQTHIEAIVWVTGVVQTVLYVDFFYYYWRSKRSGLQNKVVLPIVDAT